MMGSWKVGKLGSPKRGGQVPEAPAETEGSGSWLSRADTRRGAEGLFRGSPVVPRWREAQNQAISRPDHPRRGQQAPGS